MIHNFFLFYRTIPVFLPFFDILFKILRKRRERWLKVDIKLVGASRFERPTSCSQGRRANQAALRPDIFEKSQ